MRFLFLFAIVVAFCVSCTYDAPQSSEVNSALPPRGAIDLDTAGVSANLDTLDALYGDAINVANSAKAFFKTEAAQEAWMQHWQTLLYALGDSLIAHGINWDQKLRIFSRVYFNEQGRIDYYLYSIKETSPGYPGPGLRDSLRILLNSFAKTYRMDTAIGGKVAQCGPVSLMPPE